MKVRGQGEVFVALYLISNSKGEWGYKDLDDSVGPYYFDCPLSYIEKTIKSGRKLNKMTSRVASKSSGTSRS